MEHLIENVLRTSDWLVTNTARDGRREASTAPSSLPSMAETLKNESEISTSRGAMQPRQPLKILSGDITLVVVVIEREGKQLHIT
jgi:hypothetical protein